jgi:pyridinium-3,5-bisthiocarboxylic acid mononucleotide nickel chelatase
VRTLFLESVAGVAGDMFTAAFIDAGLLDAERAKEVPRLLGLEGVHVEVTRVHRSELSATHVDVRVEREEGHEPHDHAHHHDHIHYPELDGLLHASALPQAAKAFAREVYRLLAEAEARAHGCDVEKVSFHEVGDLDSVVDVAMAGLCVAEVAPDHVLASPVRLGRGTVRTRHGAYPVPPPASGQLVLGMPVAPCPPSILGEDVELSTPTGLAILKALKPTFRPGWPEGVVRAQGFGAGTMDLGEHPNVFRVVLLEELDVSATLEGLPYEQGTVMEIQCNVDDQTGERSGWLIQRSLELGALDAWMTSVVGKKGRPALCFTLLAAPAVAPRLADWLLRHSSTFGLRYSLRSRLMLSRTVETRDTPRGKIRYSVGHTTEGEKVKEKPEFDDLAEVWKEDPDFQP